MIQLRLFICWRNEMLWMIFVGVDFGKQWRCMQWYMMDSFLAEHVTFDCMMCRCEDILCLGEDYEAKIAAMKRRANFMQWNTHNITNMVLYITIICLGVISESSAVFTSPS